jgi:hypothetical protein
MAYNDSTSAEGAGGAGNGYNRAATLEYLVGMIDEMRKMAGDAKAPLLVSILNLAHEEATERHRVAKQLAKFNS